MNAGAEVVLGDFTLRQKIGEGGFGTVYLAEQRALARPAVVKVMRRSLSGRRDAIERFILEARLASRLDHPYAAHIYAFGAEDDGTLWIAMELVKGTSLDKLLESGRLSLERFVPMLERLCEAIGSAHQQGIVHRDIKPANVMVAAKGGRLMPKLLDFGIAKQLVEETDIADVAPVVRAKRATLQPPVSGLDQTIQSTESIRSTTSTTVVPGTTSLTQEGQILGSPPYMAPEQWIDPSLVGPWTDQYALALLAYEALSGERACDGRTLALLAEQHLETPLPVSPEISEPVHAVLARAAAKDPKDRYPDVEAFAAALRAATGWAAETEPVPALQASGAWVADAAQPIAETVAALAAARTNTAVIDRVAIVASVIVRWLGVLALACRSRVGRIDTHDKIASTVRELRRRPLRDVEWLDLAVAITRTAEHPETWPLPEFAIWCADDAGVELLRQLVHTDASISDVDVRAIAARRIAALDAALGRLDWLLDYEVGREVAGGIELWVGPRTTDRVIHRGSSEGDRVVVLDADGAHVLLMSPLVAIAPPTAGDRDEMFVFSGPSRSGSAVFSAFPAGYERDDFAIWTWLAENLLAVATSSDHELAGDRPPYPGLAAFTSEDQASFVGREHDATDLVNRLRAHPVVTVVGPSGAGKTSFLAAGLVPRMPAGWHAITVRPGRDPVAVLAAACQRVEGAPYRVATSTHHAMLVVIVDQAEELFTQGATDEQRAAFASELVTLTGNPNVRVVLAVRDDFLCRLDEVAAWRGIVTRCVQVLAVPGRDELERIVAEPAKRRGFDFDDPSLPSKMVDEVIDQPGALPMLSFAAAELWERRDRHFKHITRQAYDQIGGVAGALVRHADGVVDAMPPSDRGLVRRAFRRLLTVEGTRVVHGRDELVAALGGHAAAVNIVERLIEARLVVAREDDDGDRIEIIHEALARTWPRLEAWQREDISGARLHQQLVAASRHWHDRGRPDGLLWRGDALDELRRWRTTSDELSAVETDFVDASEAVERRGRRRKVAIVSALLAGLSCTVVVLAVAQQRISAQRAAAVRRVAAGFEERGRLSILAGDNARALVYLAEASRLGHRGATYDLLVEQAATSVEPADGIVVRDPLPVVAASWDGDAIVTSHDAVVRLWDRTTGKPRVSIANAAVAQPVPGGIAAITNDGDVVVTAASGSVRWRADKAHPTGKVWNLTARGPTLLTYRGSVARLWNVDDGTPRGELRHDQPVQKVALDTNGRRAATASTNEVRIWEVAGAALITTCKTSATRITSLIFTSTGDRVLAGGDDGVIYVCDAKTGDIRFALSGHLNGVGALDVAGDVAVSGSGDATARIWNLATGRAIAVLVGHNGSVRALALSPDGSRVATGSYDGRICLWDVETGTQLGSLEGHGQAVTALTWRSADRIESAGFDGTVRAWDLAAAIHDRFGRDRSVVDVLDVSPDSTRLLTVSGGTATVWDARTLERRDAIPGRDDITTSLFVSNHVVATTSSNQALLDGSPFSNDDEVVATSANGRLIATASHQGTVRVWRPDGALLGTVPVGYVVRDLVFDEYGRWLAVLPHEGVTASIVDTTSVREVTRLSSSTSPTQVTFGRERIAIATPTDVTVFELGTWTRKVSVAPKCRVIDIKFVSNDRLVMPCDGSGVSVWDREGMLLATLPGTSRATAIATQGRWLAVGTMDGTVGVWDLETYRLLATHRGHRTMATILLFAPDGSRLFSTSADGRVASWDLSRSTRSQAELDKLVKCRVPYRLEGEAVLPRAIDFDDPTCR